MSLKVGQKPQLYAIRPQGGAYYGAHENHVQNRGLLNRLNSYDTYQVPVAKNLPGVDASPYANKFDRLA